VITSICLQSPPPVRLTPGTLASSGGAKVLSIGGLQRRTNPEAAHPARRTQAGL
jgi:hypothetical protein